MMVMCDDGYCFGETYKNSFVKCYELYAMKATIKSITRKYEKLVMFMDYFVWLSINHAIDNQI